jgi:excisionase family DNA binding protein
MLTPGELGTMLHVDAKTVSRWAREGTLEAVVTPGGHRRFPLATVLAFLATMGLSDQAAIDAVRGVQ